MSTKGGPKVFLSHAHLDKGVARRLVRRLTAHGIKVWIDERELRFGATLATTIRTHIEQADVLLVIASQASADSKWVGLELDFAKEHDKTIIPFFVDPLDKHDRFRDFLGVYATIPEAFHDVVHNLMQDLFLSVDQKLPSADAAVLTTGLRELAKEEPNLAPLILGCLDYKGLHLENIDTAFSVAFHPLDEALNALFDLNPDERLAYHAASGFAHVGAGARALSLWIAKTGDGGLPLVNAVGINLLNPSVISTAIKLLTACSPPNNHALYNFIHHNSKMFDDVQRRAAIRLVTWPVRSDTSNLGDVLGWVALQHLPGATEIQQMWVRWIYSGVFDGKTSTPKDLANCLSDAHKEALLGRISIEKALQSHVRTCLRSGDKHAIRVAIDHIQAIADVGIPLLSSLLDEANGSYSSWEWDKWSEKDPETAELMKWWIFNIVKEARGDRNWLRALQEAKKMVDFEKQRRQILNENSKE